MPRPPSGLSLRLLAGLILPLLAVGCSESIPDSAQSDFDFRRDAFSFSNFGSDERPSEMTAALAVRMFGAEAVCVNEDPDHCELRAEAASWIEEVNQTLEYGHSEGMAVASLLMSLGKLSPSDFGADHAAALSVENVSLTRELAYWSATQKIEKVHALDQRFAAKDVMPFLAKVLQPGQSEQWTLLVAMREGDRFIGGHALVPFGYFKGERDGLYYLRVYDPNIPQAEQRLELDVKANTWKYEGSFDEIARVYEGTADNGNLLSFSPVTARLGTFPAPFSAGAALSVAASRVKVAMKGNDTFVGFQDGKLVEHGGRLLPAAANCACKLPNEITNIQLSPDAGTGEQEVLISSDGYSEDSNVHVTGPGLTVSVEDVKADTAADVMKVDANGKAVSYDTGGDSAVNMTASVQQADGSTTTVTVTVGGTTRTVTVDANDPDNVVVSCDDMPGGTPITVTVTTTDAHGETKTTTATATTTSGKDAQVTVQPEAGTSEVNTNLNLEPCLNGKKDADEGDTDCGAVCLSKPSTQRHSQPLCTIDQSCGSDADCEIGNCVGGACKAPTCTDGKKNGNESDVDCGYAGCPACEAGAHCLGSSQCASGLSCLNGTCLSSVDHTLFVEGLPEGESTELSVVRDDQWARVTVAGQPASFAWQFSALQSFAVGLVPATSLDNFVCDLDHTNPSPSGFSWSWTRDGGDSNPQTNTLRCHRVRGELQYTTRGTGCPLTIGGKFLAGLGPTVHFTVKSKTGTPSSSWGWLTRTNTGGTLAALFEQPDQGTAYAIDSVDPEIRTLQGGPRYLESCTLVDGGTGPFPAATGVALAEFDCTCTEEPDGGFVLPDAGTDTGVDAGVDAGIDAGTDAGVDAGMDAGTSHGIGAVCTQDSDCDSNDCWCGTSTGSCASNTGVCGAGRIVVSSPTDGTTPSGTFTVPAQCTSVRVQAWGAAGGGGESAAFPSIGGAGGYVGGTLAVSPGDVLSFWVGAGGANAVNAVGTEGTGSYLGTPANGGLGDGQWGGDIAGGGGGLSSFQQTGSVTVVFTVPGGAGAGPNAFGEPAGGTNAGSGSSMSGGSASQGSSAGGGGAGENGGAAGQSFTQGDPGAFGTLPAGLSSALGTGETPAQSSDPDYWLCPSQTATGGFGDVGGSGCFVVRCVYP